MKKIPSLLLILLSSVLVIACNKKAPEATASPSAEASVSTNTSAVNTASASAATPAEQTPEQIEAEKKRALMDYSNMEEKYLTDTRGQWAVTAKASSAYQNDNNDEAKMLKSSLKATGAPDTQYWENNNQELGFDWLELTYAKPVQATEVRVALDNGNGSEALNKIELKDDAGNWHVIWSDISTVKEDKRGRRTWFVKSFEKTNYKVVGVKISFANNLERGYKQVDAVQLIGE